MEMYFEILPNSFKGTVTKKKKKSVIVMNCSETQRRMQMHY